MEIQELVSSVQNDVRQNAYDNEEILLLCEKTQELINQTNTVSPIGKYRTGQQFRDKAKTDLIHTIIAVSPKMDYEDEVNYFVECEDDNREIHYDTLKGSYLEEETTILTESVRNTIWSEIKNDFEDDGVVFIDAWVSTDENESGKVIAKVRNEDNGKVVVDYLDERAKTDPSAQELIQETVKGLEANHITTYIMVWIDEEEKWYYFLQEFDSTQFPDGYVDYTIKVNNGLIVEDTFKQDTIGKSFAECYQESHWKSVSQ